MKPPIPPETPGAPVMAVIAGLPGSGKTTLLEQMMGEDGFPAQLVVDLPESTESLDQVMNHSLALRQSVAVETCCDHAAIVEWMVKAAERGFSVELIIVGIESDQLLLERHGRQVDKRKMLEAIRRMSSAVDHANRVVAIDNSTGTPFVAASIESGNVNVLDARPTWVSQRIIAPRLVRIASFKAIRTMYQAMASNATIGPVLQVGGAGAAMFTGRIVAASDYHVLQ